MPEDVELWTVNETAERLRVSPSTVWRLAKAGVLVTIKPGRLRLIVADSARDYLRRLIAEATRK